MAVEIMKNFGINFRIQEGIWESVDFVYLLKNLCNEGSFEIRVMRIWLGKVDCIFVYLYIYFFKWYWNVVLYIL